MATCSVQRWTVPKGGDPGTGHPTKGTTRTPCWHPEEKEAQLPQKGGTLKSAWVATVHKREGAQEPRCARSEGRCGAVGFYVVVAATAGHRARRGGDPRTPLDRPTQDASCVAQFTPLRQLRPPEVYPLVSHGRFDTGISALMDTADLDSEVNFHWRPRQDSADGLEYRRLFDLSLGIRVCAIMKFHWSWVAIDGGNMMADCAHLKYGQRSLWFWWSYSVCRI